MNPNKYLFTVLLALTAIGCSKNEPDKTPVASIDKQTLALEEIRAHIDTTREPSQAQIQQYIQRWLTEESLYREAIDRGLDRTEEMNQKVEDVRRQLAINALLEKEVYSQQTSNFTMQDVRQYYDAHSKEFNVMHDMALVSFALFKNRDAATQFRNLVLKGTQWNSAINQHAQSVVLRVDSSYRTEATLIPAELWRVASKSTNRELSFPISTDNGYYIIVVWKFIKQGQTADVPFVEQEIRGRLTVERRRQMYDQLVQNLRSKHAIQVFINLASDSGKAKTEE
ncbi:MAG: peptidyl-prolyl cis-trans isomerase [Ignavibacteriales bacterium]|nr:peptidyl-prolyl cis-trans isomerase [Ignavibacteriales bacterium]